MYNFISFGEVLIDFISTDYVNSLKLATSFNKFLGGSPSNIAVNIARQGFNSTIISKVGKDPFGDYIISKLKEYEVDTSTVIQDDLFKTDVVYVLKSKFSPEFFAYRSASLNLELPNIYVDMIKNTQVFHLSSWAISSDFNLKNALNLLKTAQNSHILTGFDPNYRKVLWETSLEVEDVIKIILPYVDIVKPSLDDCYHLFSSAKKEEEYINIFHNLGVKYVVLTLGERGAIVSDGTKMMHLDSLATKVVDTTGAGDAFWSGLYIGLIKGFDIFNASRLGSAFSAEKLKYVGAISKISNYRELIQKYNIN
ncbi:MAG TPA: sugar kinase [Defluviitoga sp.]|nr:sugar kinase [Defluviitoga sp.]HOP25074.1 sugar kinase [Defluviitoga sp.]HPZ29139.1 sugar kinase [Defluviitoga sp.]HQD63069.1 sugar kinase [Defluviitoga sp.]